MGLAAPLTQTPLTGEAPTTPWERSLPPASRTREVADLAGVSAVTPLLSALCAPAASRTVPPGVELPSSSWSIAAVRITLTLATTTTWPVTAVGSTTPSTTSCRPATLTATTTTRTCPAAPSRLATVSPTQPTPSEKSPTAVPPPRTLNPNSPLLSLKSAPWVLLSMLAELASSSTAAEST